MILLCAGYGASNTALTIATDMAVGIMDRFRSMPIATGSVLAGHIIASVCRNLLTTAVVVGVATAIGFRAENQPVTPVIEAIRGLAIGLGSDAEPVTGLESTVTLAFLWCAAIAATFLGVATWGFRSGRT